MLSRKVGLFLVGILVLMIAAYTVRGFVEEEIFSKVLFEDQNLISNGDIEILEDGRPVGWKGYSYLPFVNLGHFSLGTPGFQSEHALIMSAAEPKIPKKWGTQIKDVKPHTRYTLSFWYRLPETGVMEVHLFGARLPVTKMFQYNPMHWCRYSAIVDSGNHSGDCSIEFLAQKGVGPFRCWVDQIELFEGESPIGKNCARLEYQYYNEAHVSPDLISPLPFAFEWTFAEDQRPPEIQYVIELPSEVELVGCALGRICKWPPGGWDITWLRPDYTSQVKTEDTTIDNRPYTRIVAHVPCVPGDQRQLTDYVVPVGIRDYWESTPGQYSGMISMCLYLRSKVKKGSFPFYYYAMWNGGRQPRRQLNLEITRIAGVSPPQSLCLISDVQLQAGDRNPQLGQDFLHIGLNGIGAGGLYLRGGDGALKEMLDRMRGSGLKYFSAWANIPAFRAGEKEARAMDRSGQRSGSGGWCLSYRGQDWVKEMNRYKEMVDSGVNFFAFDDALPCTCFCDRCKHAFAEFLKSNTDLPYMDPLDFLQEDWKGNQRYWILWSDFCLWHYGKTVQEMKDELLHYFRSRGLNNSIYFGISSWLPFTSPFAARTLHVFDFDIRQTYINWASSSFGGSPKLVGDYLYQSQERLGPYARPLAPTLSPGLTYMHPACALDPYAQMKYQILEAMMAPNFAGYIMYDGKDIDVGDMKYMAEANALMRRFERIVVDGHALRPIEINRSSGVRIKELESEGLVLVSDYSTYESRAGVVRVSLKDLGVTQLIDTETGEKIKPIAGSYDVEISARRARLFYFKHEEGP